MIQRLALEKIRVLLGEFPVVGVLGPRQVGKTTLAEILAHERSPKPVYLDLESPTDQAKIAEPEQYFALHKDKLIILDEIQRAPGLFSVLRSVVDQRRKEGQKVGQFLILGSASLDLLKQSSETLAGRIAYFELRGLSVLELISEKRFQQERLWLRGGFPDSYLSGNDEASFRWRQNFIGTYLERDVPQMGPRIPAVTLRRLWTMLAHGHGGQFNMAKLATNLELTGPTIKRYIDLLEDLFLVRSLRPWHNNVGKRLVKTPKLYIRDSGLTHALLNLTTLDDLLGHPVVGASWEGFVIEQLLSVMPESISPWFYRTSAGAEIDLVLEINSKKKFAIEIKRTKAPSLSKGFHLGCQDIKASHKFIVYAGSEQFPISKNVTAIPVDLMMKEIQQLAS
jgi:predicted AAA+ superfamily ATPase